MTKLLLLLSVFALSLAACGPAPAPRTEITVIEGEYSFGPNIVRVPLGQQITITIRNDGILPHDFAIAHIEAAEISGNTTDSAVAGHDMHSSEYVIHVATSVGGTNMLVFTPLEAGEYEFICTIEGHREAGMIGTLIVVAPE